MQDTEYNPRRRAEDRTPDGGPPTVADCWERSGLAHKRITQEIIPRLDALDRAFVKDDLGTPDTEGHRKAHLKLIETEHVINGYKNEATKKIITWLLAIFLGAMSSGVMLWLRDHLK